MTESGDFRDLVQYSQNASSDILLPEAIAKGNEPFFIIGAIAGG